jgi:hypothetical protein
MGVSAMAVKTTTSALCDQCHETVTHLMLGCVYSRQVYHLILEPLGLTAMVIVHENGLGDRWLHQRTRLGWIRQDAAARSMSTLEGK